MTRSMIDLPARAGPAPNTSSGIPHQQLDQNAMPALQELLWRRMCGLPGVETGPSRVSVPGARATFLPAACACGPLEAFMCGWEFAHLHPPADGSLHLTLPDALRTLALARGWGEPHPLVGSGRVPDTVIMLYGPRDRAELEIAWRLVCASHDFARGSATRRGHDPRS